MEKVEQALALIQAHPEKCDFVGPRPEASIQTAEQALGVRLPLSFRRFVSELGDGGVGSAEIYGVRNADFATSTTGS